MTQPRFSLLTAAALALVAIVTGAAYAQPGPPPGSPGLGPGQGPGMGGPAAHASAGRPQLTDEQRTKIDVLMKEQRDRTHAARDQVQKLQEQLHTELFADKLDEAKIKQLRGDLTKTRQEMLAARIDRQGTLAQILTPEQRKQMRDVRTRAARMVRRGAFGGPGMGGPGMGGPGMGGPGMGGPGMGGPGFGRRGQGFGPAGPGFGPGMRRGLRGLGMRGGMRGPGRGGFRGPGMGGFAGPGQGFGPRWRRWDEDDK